MDGDEHRDFARTKGAAGGAAVNSQRARIRELEFEVSYLRGWQAGAIKSIEDYKALVALLTERSANGARVKA